MSRAIDLRLNPASDAKANLELSVFNYEPKERQYSSMAESVYLYTSADCVNAQATLTPAEARLLAAYLQQVADQAEAHRSARVADDELQASFDEITEELRDADERGGGPGCFYAHPWVHYVPADQMQSKVQELSAAGVKRFLVLAEPAEEVAA